MHGCTVHGRLGQKLLLLFMNSAWTVTTCGENACPKKKKGGGEGT